eukprot:3801531-Pyramimonas_sp.AAC.1
MDLPACPWPHPARPDELVTETAKADIAPLATKQPKKTSGWWAGKLVFNRPGEIRRSGIAEASQQRTLRNSPFQSE